MTNKTTALSHPSSPELSAPKQRTWVQTERASHTAWGMLTVRSPRAAALAHFLTALMDDRNNAVVTSHATLAKISGMSVPTIKRALQDLQADRWIEIVQVGGKGGANAFIVNDRVGWTKGRDKLHLSHFSATVVADREEQRQIDTTELRQLPALLAGEQQLPSGPDEEPPAQPAIPGLEPELPAIEQTWATQLPTVAPMTINWSQHLPSKTGKPATTPTPIDWSQHLPKRPNTKPKK